MGYSEINKDLHEQLGGAIDTLIRLTNKMDDIRLELSEKVGRGLGLTQDELVELFWQIDRLHSGRRRNVPTVTLDTPL